MIDIIPTARPNDYNLDVYADGQWIASAKNYHAGDEVGDEIWYRGVLDQPQADVNWNSGPIACTDDDTPGIENEPEEPPVYPAPGGRAVTLQSIVIDQVAQRNRICKNCGEAHYTWRCPDIGARLFAAEPWKDVALGRELCRMRWCDFGRFRALLASLPHEHLVIYASSYQAFIRSHSPNSDLTIAQVLQVWAKMGNPALLERAA